MKKSNTSREVQRVDFVKTLYDNLYQVTKAAVKDRNKIIKIASEYLDDGLSREEVIELLILDGINRNAASNYIDMIEDGNSDVEDGLYEYSFICEDCSGKLLSSHEIQKIVKASSAEEAWQKAEELIDEENLDIEKIVSVEKLV